MTVDELEAALRAARPHGDEMIYVERRGEVYAWCRDPVMGAPPGGDPLPDAWLYYQGDWPVDEPGAWRAFFADLLAELESGAGEDRCRWPLEQPWSQPQVRQRPD